MTHAAHDKEAAYAAPQMSLSTSCNHSEAGLLGTCGEALPV